MALRNVLLRTVTRKFATPNIARNLSVIHHKTTILHHQTQVKLSPNYTSIRHLSTDNTTAGYEDEDDKEKKSTDDIKHEILDLALDYVHEHGWSRKALSLAAVDAGYSSVTEGIFKNGGDDLVLYFVKKCNRQLDVYLKEEVKEINENKRELRVSEFIRGALEFRLRMLIPYVEVWPQAGTILLKPNIARESVQELTSMLNNIWFHAGDKSSDFNWYTKRGMLGKVYMSTQLVMLNDQSPDFEKSWEFMDRRLKDVSTMGKMIGDAQSASSFAVDVAFEGLNTLKTSMGFYDKRR